MLLDGSGSESGWRELLVGKEAVVTVFWGNRNDRDCACGHLNVDDENTQQAFPVNLREERLKTMLNISLEAATVAGGRTQVREQKAITYYKKLTYFINLSTAQPTFNPLKSP